MDILQRRKFIQKAGLGIVAATTLPNLLGCNRNKNKGVDSPSINLNKTYEWKMVTAWPQNFPGLGVGANNLAKMIQTMSSGRIKIKIYAGGELVPPLGVFDAVKDGVAEMGHAAAYYWKGKVPAAQFFTAVPFGLNSSEMSGWIYYGGGQELWDQLYAQFDLKPFPIGSTGVQMGGWFNKEINSLDDLKGLKMRMPGLGGEVLNKAGATAVSLPGGEIFSALESGSIDATEWVGPYNDLAFGFYKITKYYYWPGWHEPGSMMECIVNKKKYEALPKDLQEIIYYASIAANNLMTAEYTAKNNFSLMKLVEDHDVKLRKFPTSLLKKLGEISEEVVADVAKKSKMSKKIYRSFKAYKKQAADWDTIGEQAYSLARKLMLKQES